MLVCDLTCQNGGTLKQEDCICECVPGYDGSNCSNDIDNCVPNPCQNGGTCADGINSYTCNCVAGYTGSDCETNIDDCDPNPCQNGGTCEDGVNSYICMCTKDFTNENCTEYIGRCPDNYKIGKLL